MSMIRNRGRVFGLAGILLCAVARLAADGLPNEYALSQRWRELFMMRSPIGNPALLTEADYITARGAFAPVLQGAFKLWELGVTVPIGFYHSVGATVVGENAGDVEVSTIDAEGRIVATGERTSNNKALVLLTYAINPWRRLSAGANLSLAYESNFGNSVTGTGLDLGLTWRLTNHPILGKHLLGLSTQNLITPAMTSSAPIPAFSEEGAYARGLKVSWFATVWNGRIESAVDFDLRDFFAQASEFQTFDQSSGQWLETAKDFEWGVSWRVGGWVLRALKLYAQIGFDADGVEYWGFAGGVDVPSVNRGRRLSMLYQYNIKEETDLADASSHTFYAFGEFGRHREEVYARRLARLLSLSPNTLYNRAVDLFYKGKFWESFFVFGQLQTLYPEFFKMDWVDYYMGGCQEMLDMRESSGKRYRAMVSTYTASPAAPLASLGMMRLYYRDADLDGVRGQYEVLTRPDVSDSIRWHAHYLMGQAYMAKGELARAVEVLIQIPHIHPEYTFARHSMVLAYLQLGEENAALQNMDEIILSRPRTREQEEVINRTFALLGFYFYDNQSLSKAVTALRMIPEKSYYYDDALLGLGWCALKARQWQDCAEIGRKLRQRTPHDVLKAEAVLIESYAYLQQKRHLEAAALLSSAYETAKQLSGPAPDSLRVRRESNRMTRVVYDSLAEETNRYAQVEPGPASMATVNRMQGEAGGMKQKLDSYLVFRDGFIRAGFFARGIAKVQEDIEYLYVFVRKKAGEEKGIQAALEIMRKQQNIDADIGRLKKELEMLNKQESVPATEPKTEEGGGQGQE